MARSQPGVPKALVEVSGFPLIVLAIRSLTAAGVRDIRVSVHHRAQEIIHELRRRSDVAQASVEFIVEEEPLGTIGALAELRGLKCDVLVQNADLLSGIDLGAMRLMAHGALRANAGMGSSGMEGFVPPVIVTTRRGTGLLSISRNILFVGEMA